MSDNLDRKSEMLRFQLGNAKNKQEQQKETIDEAVVVSPADKSSNKGKEKPTNKPDGKASFLDEKAFGNVTNRTVFMAGGVILAILAIGGGTLGYSQYKKAERERENKILLDQQNAQLEKEKQQQLEDYLKTHPPKSYQDEWVALSQNPNQANHWLLKTDTTNEKLIDDSIQRVLSQDPRFMPNQGLQVNDGKALLPLNDGRLANRLIELKNKVSTVVGQNTVQSFQSFDGDSSEVFTFIGVAKSTGGFMTSLAEVEAFYNSIDTTVQTEWTAQKALIDNDPSIINAKDGIISLEPEQPEVDHTAIELQQSQARVKELEGSLSKLDKALADEVANTNKEKRLRQEQTEQVAKLLQKIENSPNAQDNLKAYELNEVLKKNGIKILGVKGDLVFIEDAKGDMHIKRTGEALKFGQGGAMRLGDIEPESGAVMVLPSNSKSN